MSNAADIRLVAYTWDGGIEEALAVYARVWPDRDMDEACEGFARHAGYADFHGMVALLDGEPVGVAYGARSVPGIPWHDWAVEGLGPDHPALQDAWRLVELAVVEDARGMGIGGQLHDARFEPRPCSRGLVCTASDNHLVRGMYERRGWTSVDSAHMFPGMTKPYAILGRAFRSRPA